MFPIGIFHRLVEKMPQKTVKLCDTREKNKIILCIISYHSDALPITRGYMALLIKEALYDSVCSYDTRLKFVSYNTP